MISSKVLLIGAVGIGTLTLMSFSKPQKQTAPITVVDPPIEEEDVLIIDPVETATEIPNDEIIVADTNVYVNADNKLVIKPVARVGTAIVNLKTSLTVDLEFYNGTEQQINLKTVDKIRITKNGATDRGTSEVSFNDIILQPNAKIVLKSVVLNGLANDYYAYKDLTSLQTVLTFNPVFNYTNPNEIIVAPDVATSDLYIAIPDGIYARILSRNSFKYYAGNIVYDYNIEIENQTNEKFYLKDISAIKLFLMFGGQFREVSTNNFSFNNLVILPREKTQLQNIELTAKSGTSYQMALNSLFKETDLQTQTKLELI